MFGLGLPEIAIILIVFGILFFGGKKMVGLARSMGRFGGEFKKGKADIERELRDAAKTDETSTPTETSQSTMTTTDSAEVTKEGTEGEGNTQNKN